MTPATSAIPSTSPLATAWSRTSSKASCDILTAPSAVALRAVSGFPATSTILARAALVHVTQHQSASANSFWSAASRSCGLTLPWAASRAACTRSCAQTRPANSPVPAAAFTGPLSQHFCHCLEGGGEVASCRPGSLLQRPLGPLRRTTLRRLQNLLGAATRLGHLIPLYQRLADHSIRPLRSAPHRLRGKPRPELLQELLHHLLRQPLQPQLHRPGSNRGQQQVRISHRQDELRVCRRLLQQLEQRIGCLRARLLGHQSVCLSDQKDLPACLEPGSGPPSAAGGERSRRSARPSHPAARTKGSRAEPPRSRSGCSSSSSTCFPASPALGRLTGIIQCRSGWLNSRT